MCIDTHIHTKKKITNIINYYQEWGHYYDKPDHMVLRPLELVCGRNVAVWNFELEKALNTVSRALMAHYNGSLEEC